MIMEFKPDTHKGMPYRFIQRVNREEEESEGQKQKTRTGIIMFLGLSHNRGKQNDPRLACFMFQNIYRVYIVISRTKKKVIMLCYSQARQNMKKPTE